jgi:hypothetical protein
MKTVEVGQFAENLDQFLQDSQSETIVVTRGGIPCAVMQGLNFDEEDLQNINSNEFWSMIRERRNGPTIPWEIARQRLELLDE